MRISRFFLGTALVTVFSLLYVHQQSEVFRFAYAGQKRVAVFEELLDKNSLLRYNINKSASLVHIADKVSTSGDFEMPQSYRLIKLVPVRETGPGRLARAGRENLLSRFFGIKREAEAKTINP